eukprot:scaffold92825_cov66-Phaeocystis_antarctica.AAC.6
MQTALAGPPPRDADAQPLRRACVAPHGLADQHLGRQVDRAAVLGAHEHGGRRLRRGELRPHARCEGEHGVLARHDVEERGVALLGGQQGVHLRRVLHHHLRSTRRQAAGLEGERRRQRTLGRCRLRRDRRRGCGGRWRIGGGERVEHGGEGGVLLRRGRPALRAHGGAAGVAGGVWRRQESEDGGVCAADGGEEGRGEGEEEQLRQREARAARRALRRAREAAPPRALPAQRRHLAHSRPALAALAALVALAASLAALATITAAASLTTALTAAASLGKGADGPQPSSHGRPGCKRRSAPTARTKPSTSHAAHNTRKLTLAPSLPAPPPARSSPSATVTAATGAAAAAAGAAGSITTGSPTTGSPTIGSATAPAGCSQKLTAAAAAAAAARWRVTRALTSACGSREARH